MRWPFTVPGTGWYNVSSPPSCHAERNPTISHTLKVIASGIVLLGLFLLVGRLLHGAAPLAGMATAARWFIPIWLIAAVVNLWVGVAKAGYSVAEEAPIFLVVFAVPAAAAVFLVWRLSRA